MGHTIPRHKLQKNVGYLAERWNNAATLCISRTAEAIHSTETQDRVKQETARLINARTLIKQQGQLTSAGKATNKLYPLVS